MTFRSRIFVAALATAGVALSVPGVLAAAGYAGPAGAAAAVTVAAVFAWIVAGLLTGRLRAIADAADRYGRGDFTQPTFEYGRDEIGTVARVLDTSVRELRRRLDEMTTERAQQSTILAGMAEGVVLVDEDRRIAMFNAAAGRMLHLSPEAAGRTYKDVLDDPDVAGLVTAAMLGETPTPREVRIARASDRTYIATAVSVAHDPDGGVVLVLHDVTELRRADQMRRDFVANVSHELRTPLTAVRGYVEALSDSPNLDETQRRRFLEIIARHTLRMERLVRDLLRLARLDAGQELLERAVVPLDALMGGVTADMEDALAAKAQRVVYDFAPDAGTVVGDPAKLHDVFRNLVENASNYGPAGSAITIASRRDADRVVISVADRGPGISPADLPRIFERFYRADHSRTRDSGGTGLGLAIVRHLVQLHGGTVSAAAREGGGTTVTVTL